MSRPDPYQLRAIFDRWSKLEDAKDKLGDDLLSLFADIRKRGFDTAAVRSAFRIKRNIDSDPATADNESEEVVRCLIGLGVADDVASRAARHAPALHTHVRAREEPPLDPNSIKARARAIVEADNARKAAEAAASSHAPREALQ